MWRGSGAHQRRLAIPISSAIYSRSPHPHTAAPLLLPDVLQPCFSAWTLPQSANTSLPLTIVANRGTGAVRSPAPRAQPRGKDCD